MKKLPSQQLSTPKKNLGKKHSKLDLEDFSLEDALEMELPATQDSMESDHTGGTSKLLKKALETSPVPARKKTIKEHLKKKAADKKEQTEKKKAKNKKNLKKQSGTKKAQKKSIDQSDKKKAQKKSVGQSGKKKAQEKEDLEFDTNKLFLMPYKKTGAWAIRIRNGKQLFQVSCFDQKKNQMEAQKLMDMLKGGQPLVKVLQKRDRLHL